MDNENENKMCGCEDYFEPRIGSAIPSYKIKVFHNEALKTIDIKDFKDKWLILFFYPADFTFVCPTELEDMAEKYEEFQKLGAEIVSISTDTVFVHKAWHDTSEAVKKIKFPMAADMSGDLSSMFNVLIEEGEDAGLALRGTFIIDPKGVIRSIEVNDNSIGRNVDELFRKLQAAKYVYDHGNLEVCPARWKPGEETLKPGLDLVGKI
jgi:peroxiredoxin (alkyl hydroperoxide reductase subunit C)